MTVAEPLDPPVPEPTGGPRRALLVAVAVAIVVLLVAGFLVLRAVNRPDPVPLRGTDTVLKDLGFQQNGILASDSDPRVYKVLHEVTFFDWSTTQQRQVQLGGGDHVYFVVMSNEHPGVPPITTDLMTALCVLMHGTYSLATGPDYAVAVSGPSTQRVIDGLHLRDARTIPC